MSETYIVIGAGHAGGMAVANLRSKGFEGNLILYGEEPYDPYERPPLSKHLLAGEIEIERTYLKKPDWYAGKNIDLRKNVRVEHIDREAKTVTDSTGATVKYDKLLLATGARVRKLSIPGADLDGIFYLREIDDTLAIQKRMIAGAKVVIVGGGYIGLEVAAVAAKAGCDVTILEGLDRVMNRVVAPEVSEFYDTVHRDAGVKIHCGVAVTGFSGDGALTHVECGDGTSYPADIAVVGIGVIPNVELAEKAGLEIDNGIVVDEFAQTDDPDIWAAGDVTNHPNAILGGRLRLESVQNAVDQAKTAAAAMCGEPKAYAEVPWFWSDQYDLKLQIVGLSRTDDDVVLRGDPASHSFSVVYLRDGKFVAINAINAIKDFMAAKKLVAADVDVDPGTIADTAKPLKALLP